MLLGRPHRRTHAKRPKARPAPKPNQSICARCPPSVSRFAVCAKVKVCQRAQPQPQDAFATTNVFWRAPARAADLWSIRTGRRNDVVTSQCEFAPRAARMGSSRPTFSYPKCYPLRPSREGGRSTRHLKITDFHICADRPEAFTVDVEAVKRHRSSISRGPAGFAPTLGTGICLAGLQSTFPTTLPSRLDIGILAPRRAG
jgi:hypothetical protein